MIRRILCPPCGKERAWVHPDDKAAGLVMRTVKLRVKKPKLHGMTMNGEFRPLPSLLCDSCDQPIADGAEALAVTYWNTKREGEPGPWEEDFRHAS